MTSPQILLKAHGLRPQKWLGQNFLADPSTARMIVSRACVGPEEIVVEIGSGLGALTVPLARSVHRVYAIEKDPKLAGILRSELLSAGTSNVLVMETDVLGIDFSDLARDAGRRLTVFGNLPYNISSQVVIKLTEARESLSRAILMFQKELAVRLRAVPGGRDYGRISAMLAYCAWTRSLAVVKAKSFYPSPKVDSEVLEIAFTPEKHYPPHDPARLFRLIAAAFNQRRKTLKKALTGSDLRIGSETAAQVLVRAGIDPRRRAETLSAEEFVAIEICLRQVCGPYPPI
jgi:16S rRNA (adenine1518-N6/adenine1519-N6)-dimethyltransferase